MPACCTDRGCEQKNRTIQHRSALSQAMMRSVCNPNARFLCPPPPAAGGSPATQGRLVYAFDEFFRRDRLSYPADISETPLFLMTVDASFLMTASNGPDQLTWWN